MKQRLLLALFTVIGFFATGQNVYNPSNSGYFTPSNKPFAVATASPDGGRSMKLDSINRLFRPFNGVSEVYSYFPVGSQYRQGNFIIVVDSGGTLQSNGTYIGGSNTFYEWKDSFSNAGLIKMNLFGVGGCSGCLLAANNLSDLSNASLARSNLGLGTMATQNVAAGGDLSGNWNNITVAKFNGQLPSYYLNYANLTNTPPAVSLTTVGTSGLATYNPTTGVLNIPNYTGGGGSCLNCNADTIGNIPLNFVSFCNNCVLTLDSTAGYAYWAPSTGGTASLPPNGGSGFRIYSPQIPAIRSLVCASGCTIDSTSNTGSLTFTVTTSGVGTVTNFSAVNITGFATQGVTNATTTPQLTYTLINAPAYNVWGNNTSSPGAPAYFAPNLTILNQWASGSIALLGATQTFTGSNTFNGGVFLGSSVGFSADNTYNIGSTLDGAANIYSRNLLSTSNLLLGAGASSSITFDINGVTNAQLLSTGQLNLTKYTTPTSFTGTATSVLEVDASGNIIQGPITYNLYAVEGTSPIGTHGDSVQFGGSLGAFFQPDTLYTNGQPFYVYGLPDTVATNSSDSVPILNWNHQMKLVAVSAIGGGGGGDAITSPNGSLTVGGTSTNTTLDLNLGYSPTLTGAWSFNGGINVGSNIVYTGTTATYQIGSLTNLPNKIYTRNIISDGNLSQEASSTGLINWAFNGVQKAQFNYTGQWQWGNYVATNSFTLGSPVGMLVFDASGNIGTQSIGGGGSVIGVGQIAVTGSDSVKKADSVFFRGLDKNAGIVIAGNSLNNLGEPSPAYDTAQVISTSLPVVRMLYTDDTLGVGQQNYAESIDGAPGTWSIVYDVIPGHYRGCMVKNGGYYMYFGVNTAETQVDVYESPHGAPGSWTLQNSAVITASSLGATNIYNSWVYINQVTGTWYMLLDVGSVEYGFSDYGLTSTDGHGVTWTAVTGNPVLPRLAAPWFTYYGGKYYCWGLSSMTNAILPSDLYEYSATNFTGPWTMVQTGSIAHRLTSLEGVNGIIGQVADPALVSLGDSSTLLLVAVTANGNGSGGSQIAAYRSPLSITKLITTSSEQNAPFTPEWEQFNGGNIAYNNGNVGIGINTPLWPLQIGENPGNYIQGYPGASAIYARNFISSTSFGNTILGYNLYEGAYGGWQIADSTAGGYAFDLTSSGITTYYAAGGAGHTIPLPLNLGSWKYASANTTSVFTLGAAAGVANGRLLFNGNGDDLSGASIQCIIGSLSAEFGNITTGTINTDYLSTGNAGAGNLGIGPTKAFAASSTGTTNLAVLASLSSCSSCAGNTAIGAASGASMTTGDYNTFIGSNSATSGTVTGNFNVAVGRSAAANLAGGSENTVGGADGGRALTSGAFNTQWGGEGMYQGADGFATPAGIDSSTCIGYACQVTQNSTSVVGGYGLYRTRGGQGIPAPQGNWIINNGLGIAGHSGFGFLLPSIATTALSGNGTQMTLTFATQSFAPFIAGQQISVSGAAPSGYNGVWTVSSCTTTSVVVVGTVTGSQTSAGTIITDGEPTATDYGTWGAYGEHVYYRSQSGTLYDWNNPATPTLQQVLTAGSTLTGNNTIVIGSNTLTIGGGTFAGASNTNATFAHFVGNSSSPTIAAGSGAGSSPTVSVTGTDQDGLIVITTGTLPSGSTATIVTVTFSASFPNNTFITLTPANITTAALTAAQVYPTGTTTNFSIISNVTALTAATQYSWFYHVGAN